MVLIVFVGPDIYSSISFLHLLSHSRPQAPLHALRESRNTHYKSYINIYIYLYYIILLYHIPLLDDVGHFTFHAILLREFILLLFV